jgi:hypothetical protein
MNIGCKSAFRKGRLFTNVLEQWLKVHFQFFLPQVKTTAHTLWTVSQEGYFCEGLKNSSHDIISLSILSTWSRPL